MATMYEISEILTPEYLTHEYVDKEKFASEIATEVGCSIATVTRYLRKYKINVEKRYRNRDTRGSSPVELLLTKELLEQMYLVDKRTVQDIARSMGTTSYIVKKRLLACGMGIENHRSNAPTTHLTGVTTVGGYLAVYLPEHHRADSRGYAKLHTILAEYYLKRALRSDECVHHIDKDILNNHPANLSVMTSGEHTTIHNRGSAICRKDMLNLQERQLQELQDKKPVG